MSYYGVGDYYMAGDPGLFSSIGSFLGGVGKTALGFLTGGPIGGIGAAVGALTGGSGGSGPSLKLSSSVPTITGGRIGASSTPAAAGAGHKGYHLNKHGYYTKAGYVAPESKYVKNRRTNFANGRAISRANRRVDGFVRLARRSLKHTKYHLATTRHRSNERGRRSR